MARKRKDAPRAITGPQCIACGNPSGLRVIKPIWYKGEPIGERVLICDACDRRARYVFFAQDDGELLAIAQTPHATVYAPYSFFPFQGAVRTLPIPLIRPQPVTAMQMRLF